ncbi:Putative ribonuclease H protein At1g65750 [Linum perenne]
MANPSTWRGAKCGEAALKIDISKAYDRVEWGYLEAMLLKMEFGSWWVDRMMLCVKSVDYSILINSHSTEAITPGRGLRQGCPLSPFLFVICAEGLSALIRRAASRGEEHVVRVCRGAPYLTHLLFADDSFFFFRADIEAARAMKRIFDTYANASEQLINYAKSGITFNKSTHVMLQDGVASVLGITEPFDRGRYLNLPSMVGRNKWANFQFIKDRVWERIQSWRGKMLSAGGKEVLIKSVLQAIPTFYMNVFLLPKTTTEEIERMINSFWWGMKATGGSGITWMRWERLCVRKLDGGMGCKDLYGFNLAMVGKQGWKFMKEPNALVSRIFKAKYFPHGDFLSAPLSGGPSQVWRGIWETQELIRCACRWRIGDKQISVWNDQWLKLDGQLRTRSSCPTGCEEMMVRDLWIPGTRYWDVGLLEELFSPDEVKAILGVTCVMGEGPDHQIWHYDDRGAYTVKSAYKVYMCHMMQRGMLNVSGEWKRLWDLAILPKFKNFGWRLARGILPLRKNIIRRRVEVPRECGVCSNLEEDKWHLFIYCPFAMDCWMQAGIWHQIQLSLTAGMVFGDWFMLIVKTWDGISITKWVTVMWAIWKERNQRVWNRQSTSASVVVSGGLETLHEWQAVWLKSKRAINIVPRQVIRCGQWHPPKPNFLKCNVDASIRENELRWGSGMVLRSEDGSFVSGRTGWSDGVPEIREAEALSLLDALNWVENNKYNQVISRSIPRWWLMRFNGKSKIAQSSGIL